MSAIASIACHAGRTPWVRTAITSIPPGHVTMPASWITSVKLPVLLATRTPSPRRRGSRSWICWASSARRIAPDASRETQVPTAMADSSVSMSAALVQLPRPAFIAARSIIRRSSRVSASPALSIHVWIASIPSRSMIRLVATLSLTVIISVARSLQVG
jgi:hypothetical protein